MTYELTQTGPMLHVRLDGRSHDLEMNRLGLNAGDSDLNIRQSVANWLDVDPGRLSKMVIERNPDGSLTLRPEAVFG